MKVLERKKVTLNVTLPCDICGKGTRTARRRYGTYLYLEDRARRRGLPGYGCEFYDYGDDLIYLCEKCIDKIKASLVKG